MLKVCVCYELGYCVCFFFFKQKTAYEIMPSLVGSEMCIETGEKLPTILVGAGRLGSAVSSFISRDANGYKLLGVFDVNPDLIGKEMCGVPILPLSDLDKFCAEHHPEVAVLCVPRQSAMDLAGELVNQGIKGFWNFSHYDLSVEYPDVTVENVHLGDSLMSLGYRLRNQEK